MEMGGTAEKWCGCQGAKHGLTHCRWLTWCIHNLGPSRNMAYPEDFASCSGRCEEWDASSRMLYEGGEVRLFGKGDCPQAEGPALQ